MMDKKMIAISYDEWFPYYDIREIECSLDAYDTEKVIEIAYEDLYIYKGLLEQMEKLQHKLDKLWVKAKGATK